MSVPSVFATGHHLDLSLNGSRVTILDSLKVNPLAASVHSNYRDTLNNHEKLPSITPTDSRSVSQESLHVKNLGAHHVNSLNIKEQHFNLPNTKEILVNINLSKSEFLKENVEECWKEVQLKPAVRDVGTKDSEDHGLSDTKDEKADDLWEDELDSEDEDQERVTSSNQMKKKRRKKKKKSSKHIFKSAKGERFKNTEQIYTDMAVLERQSKLEAFCVPAKIGSSPPKKVNNRLETDYLKYVNDKAPAGASKLQSQVRTDKVLIKTKELLTAVSAKAASTKDKLKTIGKSHRISPNVVNQLKNSLTASADAVTFHLQLAKSGPNVSRKLLTSAPCDNDIPRITKVFLSEKQSKDIWELGMEIPGAPPASPTPEMLKKFEYVPSMNDIRSQRAVKVKLDYLVKIEKQRQEKIKEERVKKDKVHQKEKVKELRRQQRREIYVLNKLMTEFENKNFQEFCRQNGINPES